MNEINSENFHEHGAPKVYRAKGLRLALRLPPELRGGVAFQKPWGPEGADVDQEIAAGGYVMFEVEVEANELGQLIPVRTERGSLRIKDQAYGCSRVAYEETYAGGELQGELAGLVRKRAKVAAYEIDREAVVVTRDGAGGEESRATVPAGSWIIKNPGGEIYHNDAEGFMTRYELDD